jgi:hypothetical protein
VGFIDVIDRVFNNADAETERAVSVRGVKYNVESLRGVVKAQKK